METDLSALNIKNKNIIKENYFSFTYVEEKDYVFDNPVKDYYFKLDDFSINLIIALKWVLIGYLFFKEISETIPYADSKLLNFKEHEYCILLDDIKINSLEGLTDAINKEYGNDLFNENTKIRLKLYLSVRDLLLLQNTYIPTLYYTDK